MGDSAAVGSAAVAARRDHKHAMPAAGSGGLTFEGVDLAGSTTTSTSAVDIQSVGSLTLAAGTPILVIADWRKSADTTATVYAGLKLNTTSLHSANISLSSSTAQVENGVTEHLINTRDTSFYTKSYGVLRDPPRRSFLGS